MAHRTLVVAPMLLIAALAVGCAGMRTRSADLTKFQAAQKLEFDELQRGGEVRVTRSVAVSDPRTIAEINDLLRSVAINWKPLASTPASPQFTLSSMRDDRVTDVAWFWSPTGDDGEGYAEMRLPSVGQYSALVRAKDYHRLLMLLGASEWPEHSGNQHEEGR